MQTTIPWRKLHGHAMPLLVIGMLTWSTSSFAMPGLPVSSSGQPADTILVQKQVNTKKHKIRLYPNANHQVLFFNASGEEGRVYQLFLFNLEGKLVKQANIRNKETTVLNNMGKGNYLYEVFSDDERLENGQVIVR
ncbi:T9SS type A sorting domain-containing protein [Pseudoflavitalea sp. X16]|uniref:T9SS type A sorting domain-containing protein n=1 Tax=Paraflavitalea devenefica TaxID=2716334 RepID=UPI00141EB6CF|nr:T9SS type A sorting domain-containing protein [Paraflavitalea devenefica]NII29616.1 T9SS type A sorting domain-containing protein [Paraflavitalea devenefica]